MKKTKIFSLLSFALVGTVLASCAKEQVEVLNYSSPLFRAELRDEIKAKINESRVYKEENGQLIKINDPDDPTVNVLKELKITEPIVSMFYNNSATSAAFTESKQLYVSGSPSKAVIGNITWSSSDPTIASVDENGVVTTVSEGLATITATSEAGLVATSQVYVNNTNKTNSQLNKTPGKILAAREAVDYVYPTRGMVTNNYHEIKKCDGVQVSEQIFTQKLYASTEESYFRYIFDELEFKTQGGSPVPSYEDFIIYSTKGYLSYFFSNTNGRANYMALDQGYLMSQGKKPIDGLGLILENVFTSGVGIMTGVFEDLLGEENLTSGYKDAGSVKKKGTFGEDSGQFAYETKATNPYRASKSNEDSWGMPEGSIFYSTDVYRYLFVDGLLSSVSASQLFEWEDKGKSYTVEITVNEDYEGRNVEFLWPDMAEYTQVDFIGDLF